MTRTAKGKSPKPGLSTAEADEIARFTAIAEARGLALDMQQTYDADAVECAEWMIEALEAASEECGQPAERLFSGAGHDGLAMHDLTDIGMLFVRCRDGLSHHPDEAVNAEDAEVATRVMMAFLRGLAERG